MAKQADAQVIEGEWYEPTLTEHFEECCHCGLTHKMQYRVLNKAGDVLTGVRIELRCWVDKRRTSAARRKHARAAS